MNLHTQLTNTWQIDCVFVHFDAACCAFDELTIFIGKSPLERVGYPAWIRTKNNASKGRCVTVTPRGMRTCDFRFAIFDSSAMSKIQAWSASAEQLAGKIEVESRGGGTSVILSRLGQ
jgi:hypothetical protein